jgi:thioesterase domain-containing protein
MPSDRRRILELALESLQEKKRKLDEEIAEINRELRSGAVRAAKSASAVPKRAKRPSRFSREERLRRSQRMKAYWENWRKKKGKK